MNGRDESDHHDNQYKLPGKPSPRRYEPLRPLDPETELSPAEAALVERERDVLVQLVARRAALTRDLSSPLVARFLDWVARWVPQRVIAEWVGMTHGALRIRVWRLRERLREAAVVYADHLSPAERLELKDFFRRTAMLRREDVGDSAPTRVRQSPAPRAQTRAARGGLRGEEGR